MYMKHCKCNGFLFKGFKVPVNGIYGIDLKGFFVYTHINYLEIDKNNGERVDVAIIYRYNGKEWIRSKEYGMLSVVSDYMTTHKVGAYSDYRAIRTSKKGEIVAPNRMKNKENLPYKYVGKRMTYTKYTSGKSGNVIIAI